MLLAAPFGGSNRAVLKNALVVIFGVFVAVFLGIFPRLVAGEDAALALQYDALISFAVLSAALLLPLFFDTAQLEARQFAIYPYSPAQITTGILVTALFSWRFLLVLLWLGTRFATRAELLGPGWPLLVLDSALILGAAIAFAHAAVAVQKWLLRGTALTLLRRVLGISLLLLLAPLGCFVLFTIVTKNDAQLLSALNASLWLPTVAPVGATLMTVTGKASFAATLWIVSAAALVVSVAVCYFASAKSMVLSDAAPGDSRNIDPLGLFVYFSAKPAGVIAARSLTYLRRDPRYRVSLLAIPAAAALAVFALWIAGVPPTVLSLLPLPIMLFLLGWALHNDVAMDSTAIWLHIASGIKGFDDRLGRLAPAAAVGIPMLFIGSSISVIFYGNWLILPVVFGLNCAALLIGMAVSTVASALTPYPSTRPGESPFLQPQFTESGALSAQLVSFLCGIFLAIPVIVFSISAILHENETAALWLTALASVAFGAMLLFACLKLGGWIFERKGPEILAAAEIYD